MSKPLVSFAPPYRGVVSLIVLVCMIPIGASANAATEPLRLYSQNPSYFLFRGQPTILIGSSEHYAAVSNTAFDYRVYLDAVKAAGLNAVRIFTGTYSEPLDTRSTRQSGNSLAPDPDHYLAPWPRTDQAGAVDGRSKFDLSRWDGEFFKRLKAFMRAASDRGIVVEVALFTPFYAQMSDYSWSRSPLNARNNVNGIGVVKGADALTLKEPGLVTVQDALVRKVVEELRDFDNLYYEICNEPFHVLDVSPDWARHIARTIHEVEKTFPRPHLIAQEFDPLRTLDSPPEALPVRDPISEASIFVIHNLPEPQILKVNSRLERPMGYNETGFYGTADAAYRLQAWRYVLAGAAVAIGLDYSFTVGHEDGSFVLPEGQIGGGSAALRYQFGILASFMKGLSYVNMRPAPEVI